MKLTPAGEECLATALTPGWRRLANIMLALLVLAVTAYGFMMIRLVLHRPYAGFGVYPFNRVAYLDRHGPADRAGLREGMLIVTMNGERVGSVLDTVRQLEALQPGGEVVLQVKSGQGAAISTIRIKLEKPPLPTFLIFATFAYLVFISLALFVYYRRPDDPPVVAFANMNLSVSAVSSAFVVSPTPPPGTAPAGPGRGPSTPSSGSAGGTAS